VRDRRFTLFFTLIAIAISGAILVLSVPRPVEPAQLPPLLLEEHAAQAAIAADRALATRPFSDARLEELESLYLAQGAAELPGAASGMSVAARRRRLKLYAEELLARKGPDGLAILRARSTEQAMGLLLESSRALSDEQAALLGSFPGLMERYGLFDAAGTLRAHVLCVRAAYKARWNLIHQRPVTEGLSRVELHAYHGWMALHGGSIPLATRANAAAEFHRAGGAHGREAHAIFLFQGGALRQAEELFEQLLTQRDELRLRNMLLYTRLAARVSDT
jgi:hypothetical protein